MEATEVRKKANKAKRKLKEEENDTSASSVDLSAVPAPVTLVDFSVRNEDDSGPSVLQSGNTRDAPSPTATSQKEDGNYDEKQEENRDEENRSDVEENTGKEDIDFSDNIESTNLSNVELEVGAVEETLSSSSSSAVVADVLQSKDGMKTYNSTNHLAILTPIASIASESEKHSQQSSAVGSIYPHIDAKTSTTGKHIPIVLPTISVNEASPSTSLVDNEAARKIYPRLTNDNVKSRNERVGSAPTRAMFVGEAELLSEAQLLEFYKNDQLDFVDDFVDVFVQAEIEPRNCLHELLFKYKQVCEALEDNANTKDMEAKQLADLNIEVWEIETRKIKQQGKCNCGRNASGSTTYKVARLRVEKLAALSENLAQLNNDELNVGFCLEVRSRALALQIQWTIVDVVNKFFAEHQLTANSLPILMPITHSLSSRILLKKALSDLFYFIRFPTLPARFRTSVTGWISELGAALLKACTPDDQLFIMSQLLRCPSSLNSWAVGLVQTYITTPSLDLSVPIDSFVATISLLLRSVRYREQFLCRVIKFYEGDNTWNFVSDDGSMENANMADISEFDLIALLSQFSIKALISAVLKHFTFVHKGNRLQILLSLISFVLVLLKIFDEGLETYNLMKDFCKKVCDYIRTLVQCFCQYWDLVRMDLSETDRGLIQNEVNRIILRAAYYIVSKNCLDLWQFLVDFPYGSVTEYCRLRFQLLYRNSATMNVRTLYEISDNELISRIKSSRNLWEELCDVKHGNTDATYKVLALSSVISYCSEAQSFLVFQVIHLCFLDEATRDDYYKVGSEAVALFLEKSPALLSSLLKYIDRHVDHLDDYAADILTNSTKTLGECRLSIEDVANVLGKWLINRPIEHPASSIARRVLCSVNWDEIDGVLWLSQDVHNSCADTIVKAHIVHCKTQNGMIAKSMSKATKMALKCPDQEQQFSKFCWDVLIKLKVTQKPINCPPATNDLAAFYLFIQQKCLHSQSIFIEHGLKYFVDLINASLFKPCVRILSQLIFQYESAIDVFTANGIFRRCLEQILHADESTYAIQLIVGADVFPGPILSLIGSAIEFQIFSEESISRKKKLAHAWLQLLTCKKGIEWNADKFVIYLLGFVVKASFYFDPDTLFGIQDVFENLYKAQYLIWKESSRGIISWFSSQQHPPIIASNLLEISPWTSFVLLKAEPNIFDAFYEFLDASLFKHPHRTLDEAIKKASTKSHTYFTVDRLHFARWLEFVTLDSVTKHEAFPLALQQLCYPLLERKTYDRKKHCNGLRYLENPAVEKLFMKLRQEILPKMEKATDIVKLKSFYRAILQWLFSQNIYSAQFTAFSDYILDYMLHMVANGDKHLWIELVDTHQLRCSIENNLKMFTSCYYLSGSSDLPALSKRTTSKIDTMTKFFGILESSPLNIVAIPAIPQHQGLPACEKIDSNWYGISPVPLAFSRYLDELNKAAKTFVAGKETVDSLNEKYLELFKNLYTEADELVRIVLKCGNFVASRCPKPANVDIQMTVSHYDNKTATKINDNRLKREEEISRLLLMLDSVAITCAQLERISFILSEYSKTMVTSRDADFVKTTAIGIFYKICNFVDGVQFLFPAATQCYETCLDILGKFFIAENSAEQLNLMRIVKEGNPLNHFLVPHFTPHCIAPALLFQLYSELSHSVRDPNTSEASLALLSRLDIEHSGNRMPANQFLALMPIIFENIVYVSGTSPLRQLCMEHFVQAAFHHLPFNFSTGLKLILTGLDSQAVPAELFVKIIARFDDLPTILNEPFSVKIAQQKMVMTSEQALNCLRLFAEQLNASRRLLNDRLFNVWAQYLESICKLVVYFLRLSIYQTFNSELPTSTIEKELRDVFYLVVSIWAPMLEPVEGSGSTPWSVSENALAAVVIDYFIGHLNWLPHSIYLPPGSETVESLFWQYFTTKLVHLQRSGAHVFSVYETKLVRLNWARFWPTLLDLSGMETAIENGPVELYPVVVEIIVRVPWFQLLQQQKVNTQPLDAHRAFFSLILSVFARCVQRTANYAKSRASMESLLKLFLDSGDWIYVKAEVVEKVGEYMAANFPADLLTKSAGNNEVLKTYMCIWRECCHFSMIVTQPTSKSTVAGGADSQLEDINRKRAIHIRTSMALMLRSSMSADERRKYYTEMLTKTNQLVLTDGDKLRYVEMARELTAFWTKIPKEKEVNAMLRTLADWLKEHCESALVLLVAHTAGGTLPWPVGLHLLDECIAAYFRRRLSCDWTEISAWVVIPEKSVEWLYTTPRSDSDVTPRFFVLNAHLMHNLSLSRSAADESAILRRIADYLTSLKPKYVTNEAAFLICMEKWQRMLIRQFSNGITTLVANEELEIYLKWLRKIYVDERGSSIFAVVAKFAARKPTFPLKIQAIANIMDLYITQQQRAVNQPPRLAVGQPILNSRIHAFNELKQLKQYQELFNSGVFVNALPYFAQADTHHLGHAMALFALLARSLYTNEKFLQIAP